MSNILAIARKELKSYFASPIAYIVIGFSAICASAHVNLEVGPRQHRRSV